MKLYDASLLTLAATHCYRVLRRVVPPVGGKWIPYTAAQVTARRAAQIVAVCVCVTVPPTPASAPPVAWVPPVWTTPMDLVPLRVPFVPGVDVPEPSSGVLLVVALALFVYKGGRGARRGAQPGHTSEREFHQ